MSKAKLLTYDQTITLAACDTPSIVWTEYRLPDENGEWIYPDEQPEPVMLWAGRMYERDGAVPMYSRKEYGRCIRMWYKRPTEAEWKETEWKNPPHS